MRDSSEGTMNNADEKTWRFTSSIGQTPRRRPVLFRHIYTVVVTALPFSTKIYCSINRVGVEGHGDGSEKNKDESPHNTEWRHRNPFLRPSRQHC